MWQIFPAAVNSPWMGAVPIFIYIIGAIVFAIWGPNDKTI